MACCSCISDEGVAARAYGGSCCYFVCSNTGISFYIYGASIFTSYIFLNMRTPYTADPRLN